jgi:hypothetical protein
MNGETMAILSMSFFFFAPVVLFMKIAQILKQ